MNKGGKSLNQFRKRARDVERTVRRVSGALLALTSVVGGVGIVGITRDAIKANDELGKFATRLGIATDQLKVLQIAAELSGQKVTALTVGLQRMVRRINEAAVGTGEAKQAIIDLGLDAEKLAQRKPDEIFRAIAEKMEGVASQGQRIQLAFKLLDTEGVGLVNTMKLLNSEGFVEIEKNARAMNAVLDDFDVAQFEAAKDNLTLMGLAFEGIKNSISIEVLPGLLLMRELIVGAATDADEVNRGFNGTTFEIVRGIGAIVGLAKGILNVLRALKIVGAGFIAFILAPIKKAEEGFRLLANLLPGVTLDPKDTNIGAFIKAMETSIELTLPLVQGFEGITEEMDKVVALWRDAKVRAEATAKDVAEQRKEQAAISTELLKQLEIRRKAALAEAAAAAARSKIESIIGSTLSASQKIAADIALINAAILTARALESDNEEEINRLLEARLALVGKLVAAQRSAAGLQTDTEKAKELQQILKQSTLESVDLARKIAIVNEAILAGEGEKNELLMARIQLQRDMEKALIKEAESLEHIGEIGVQAFRNMQTILADFFAEAGGGFDNMARQFALMLRRMIAELLAKRLLLAFLKLFAPTPDSGGTAPASLTGVLTGRAHGGPLAAGQLSLVGERGPELFVPRSAGTIVPNSGLGGNITVMHNITVNGADPEHTAQILAPILEQNREQTKAELFDLKARGKF